MRAAAKQEFDFLAAQEGFSGYLTEVGGEREGWPKGSRHFLYAIQHGPDLILSGFYSVGSGIKGRPTEYLILESLFRDAAMLEGYGLGDRAAWIADFDSDADTFAEVVRIAAALRRAVGQSSEVYAAMIDAVTRD